MPEQTLDFWAPDIGAKEIDTPVAILHRQASLLGPRTSNLVEGLVSTIPEGDNFRHSLYVVAPVLSNYRYLLVEIRHGIELYPIQVLTGPEKGRRLESPEEFVSWLKRVLSSDETTRIVRTLIAQSRF